MTESAADGGAPPQTGDVEIARALAELTALPSAPLGEHHDRLAAVHEVLHPPGPADEPPRLRPASVSLAMLPPPRAELTCT